MVAPPRKGLSSLESCSGRYLAAIVAVGHAGDRETLHIRHLLPASWPDFIMIMSNLCVPVTRDLRVLSPKSPRPLTWGNTRNALPRLAFCCSSFRVVSRPVASSRAIDARWSDQTSSPVPPVTFRNLLVLTPLPLFSARRISCESSPPVGEHVVRAGHEESLLGVTDCIMGVHGTPARLPLHLVVLHRLELRPMLCGYTSGTWTGRA